MKDETRKRESGRVRLKKEEIERRREIKSLS